MGSKANYIKASACLSPPEGFSTCGARKLSPSIQFPCTFLAKKYLKALSGIASTLMQQALNSPTPSNNHFPPPSAPKVAAPSPPKCVLLLSHNPAPVSHPKEGQGSRGAGEQGRGNTIFLTQDVFLYIGFFRYQTLYIGLDKMHDSLTCHHCLTPNT